MPTGYRRGDIGTYSGEKPEEAGVAWKALNFEYKELGNEHTRTDVAKFLGIKPMSWDKVLAEFRKRYGDTKGIWLCRTREASKHYSDFGPPERVYYDEKDVVIDLRDGDIYVLDRRTPADLSLLDTGYRDESGEWKYYTPEESKKRMKQYRKQVRGKRTTALRGVR